MDKPFDIPVDFAEAPPTFEVAYQERVTELEAVASEFETLYNQIPEEAYTDWEWEAVEKAATDIENAAERADEGYVAVMYDSHAWYRIMESLDQVNQRLRSAVGIMRAVQERQNGDTG